MRKFGVWSHNRRALSPIFATILLATIVIIFGSVAFYYSNNITSTATNQYVNAASNVQQSLGERVGFEAITYSSSSKTLTVNIINSGSSNNLQINSVYLYDTSNTLVGGSPYSGNFQLKNIDTDSAIGTNSLNAGAQGYFVVTLSAGNSLTPGSVYHIRLFTVSGSSFDYEFTA